MSWTTGSCWITPVHYVHTHSQIRSRFLKQAVVFLSIMKLLVTGSFPTVIACFAKVMDHNCPFKTNTLTNVHSDPCYWFPEPCLTIRQLRCAFGLSLWIVDGLALMFGLTLGYGFTFPCCACLLKWAPLNRASPTISNGKCTQLKTAEFQATMYILFWEMLSEVCIWSKMRWILVRLKITIQLKWKNIPFSAIIVE